MIDLTKKVLPEAIIVDDKTFSIYTDYTYWISFSYYIQDKKAKILDFDYLYINQKPEDRLKGFQELLSFYLDPRELPRVTGAQKPGKQIDFVQDADLIYAAFMQQYKIDLLETKNLHWWKFQALLYGLKDTKFNEVLGFRGYDPNDKTDYKKFMSQMRDAWQIQEPDEEDQALLDAYNKL